VTPLARIAVVVGGVAIIAAVALVVRRRATNDESAHAVSVLYASEPLHLDGELVEPAWHATTVVHMQKRDGSDGRPYADVRFLWSAEALHVGLYASDHDIVSAGVGPDGPVWLGDSFHVVFSKNGVEHSIDVGITDHGGVITDGVRRASGAWDYSWQSGAQVATDTDGTVDHPGDNDEEWVVEMAIPLKSLDLAPKPGESVTVHVRRCDVTTRGTIANTPCSETNNLRLIFGPTR
jgi:hypothetical protein